MENLIDQAISEAINLACERISCNDKCRVDGYAYDKDTDEEVCVTLDVDYSISGISSMPWEDNHKVNVYSISMTIDDKVVNPYEYGVTKEDFM